MAASTTHPTIRQLSPSLINKIAAGEVIERPASVVKELLENSVDAGATRIEVALEQGGTELIRITDDGHGIPADQLELAVTSHASSKIVEADDLFRVGTFGFRGEALASIAEVSQLRIRSRIEEEEAGAELAVEGGSRHPIQPRGMPVGTTIEVRQLFYNTPVRRKFLRSPQTERAHIVEAFTRVALASPHVQMTLLHGGKTIHQLPPTDHWLERIDAFFGQEISRALIPVANEEGEASIHGFVGDPSVTRSHNRLQYLFLNARYIRDRSLQHALREAYRGLIMTGRFPICFLRLDMPFERVDVNVHPAKLEVRFQNSGPLYSQLLSTVRNRFLTTDLTARAQLDRESRPPGAVTAPLSRDLPGARAAGEQLAFPLSRPATEWIGGPSSAAPSPPLRGEANEPRSPALEAPVGGTAAPGRYPWEQDDPGPAPAARPLAVQVHNTYLVTETEEGMVVIDQHALHERILYEQVRSKVLEGGLEVQKRLVPEPVPLSAAEAAAVLEQAELLAQIGLLVEPFGGDTVLVTGCPAILARRNPAEILRDIVDRLIDPDAKVESRDLVDELLHMIACKAAVKAGDRLSVEEIQTLVEHRDLCQDAHHCPHGRPTALVFSRHELDRRFKRI